MSTSNTHAETVQQKQFLTPKPKQELSDLLWIQGKFDDDDDDDDDWLTMQGSHDTDEDV